MSTATALPKDDPRMIAWEQYKKSERYQNSKKWAAYPEHVEGSLWDAFLFGYESLARQLKAARKGLEIIERKYRRELWLKYPAIGKYGDDGEMQAGKLDFLRNDLGALENETEQAILTETLAEMEKLK